MSTTTAKRVRTGEQTRRYPCDRCGYKRTSGGGRKTSVCLDCYQVDPDWGTDKYKQQSPVARAS